MKGKIFNIGLVPYSNLSKINVLKVSKKIYPKIAAQINCVKKNGLIILVYFPAIWKAYVYKITQVNNKDPPINTNIISLKDIKIGSNIKIIAENNVIGNKW